MRPISIASSYQGVASPTSAHEILSRLSGALGVPAALLQRVRGRWRLAGHRYESSGEGAEALASIASGATTPDDQNFWTGILLNGLPDWLVLVPGSKEEWQDRADLPEPLERLEVDARALTRQQRAIAIGRANRLAHVLGCRLSASTRPQRTYGLIVRAAARAVNAEVAALATYHLEEGTLRIVATVGYPLALVEHVRLEVGEGIIGSVFASGLPFLAGEGPRPGIMLGRARYRTESCIVIPLRSEGRSLAVLSVADPHDGSQFTPDDLLALKRVVPVAALALARQGHAPAGPATAAR